MRGPRIEGPYEGPMVCTVDARLEKAMTGRSFLMRFLMGVMSASY